MFFLEFVLFLLAGEMRFKHILVVEKFKRQSFRWHVYFKQNVEL